MAIKPLDSGVGGMITHPAFQSEVKLAQRLKLRAILRLTAPTARQGAERASCEMTSVRSLRFTMSSPLIISAGGRVPRGTEVMCTSQGLLSKAHDGPLYLLNHAYDGVRCGAPTVTREAPLERQKMICSAKLYNQGLATFRTHHQLTPM